MKRSVTHYDYTCHKDLSESKYKEHLKKGCLIEGTPKEFFDEVEKEAQFMGIFNE